MRIRKRQVSSLPLFPVTVSDPNLISRSPVVVQLNGAAATTSQKLSCTHDASATAPMLLPDPPGPSDQPIEKPNDGWYDPSGEGAENRRLHKKQECLVEDERGEQKGNDSRKEMPAGIISSPSSPSSSKQDGRWCDAEKAFPLKKRRGSFENNVTKVNNDNSTKTKKRTRMKMKTKMNKKCSVQDDIDSDDRHDQEEGEEKVMSAKKRVRGGAIMEGSRCSRVNGRGWRCCQQTLVGYSLCEHHLGKGRLRSMTSVRSRSAATTTAGAAAALKHNNNVQHMPLSESSSSFPEKKIKCAGSESEEDNDDEKKPVIVTKKRMKLGIVKARSISSLLGQTNQP